MTFQVRTARDDELDAVAALTERGFGAGPYGPTTDPERLRLLRDAAGRAARSRRRRSGSVVGP